MTDIPAVGRPAAPPPPPGPAEEHRFPCQTCGGDMRYAPGTTNLVCDHCGATEPVPGAGGNAKAARELDYEDAVANRLGAAEMEDKRVTRCPNCGALVEFDGATHATECPFCATPVVTDTGTQRQIKPRGLLPFALDERQAREAMTDWLGRLWFAPNGLQDYARKGRALDGIYVPYWTYDADTATAYRGERGDAYYVTVTVQRNGKTEQVQERRIRWSARSGHVARFFNDVLVLASRSLPKRYTDGLQPWDLEKLEDYHPEYLAGFRAEGYTVALDEGMVEAKAIMDTAIRQDVRADIGGDEQRIHSIDTEWSDLTFKHVLLPVWLAAYKYGGKSYRFVVNARTGKVQGERPWSAWKIAFATLLALIVAGIAAWIYMQNQH